MIEMEFYRGWYSYAGAPKPTKNWLKTCWPEIFKWVVENVSGDWCFRVENTIAEYDSVYGEYVLKIVYEEENDAFAHRIRWPVDALGSTSDPARNA